MEFGKDLQVLRIYLHRLLTCPSKLRICTINQFQSFPNLLRYDNIVNILAELGDEDFTELPLKKIVVNLIWLVPYVTIYQIVLPHMIVFIFVVLNLSKSWEVDCPL